MRRVRGRQRILLAVAAGALLVLVGAIGQLGPLRWLYDHTLLPVGGGLTALGLNTGQFFSELTQVSDLARQNSSLAQQNATLRQQLAADGELRHDNTLLREQLGLNVAGTPHEVGADVVAFQPDSYRQFVTINKGAHSGIKTGMAVMSEGALVGTVASVSTTTARVLLVTDPEFKLTAEDQDANATGLLVGELGGGLELDDIAQTASVKAGDTVTTSGLGGVVPAGLLIGQVESVNANAGEVLQTATVQPSLQLNNLRFAFVVVGG